MSASKAITHTPNFWTTDIFLAFSCTVLLLQESVQTFIHLLFDLKHIDLQHTFQEYEIFILHFP